MAMTPEEIVRNFHEGRGGEGLERAAALVREVAAAYERRVDELTGLTARMESAWRGGAAEAARRGAGPLAVEHGLAVPDIETACALATRQVEAFERARRAVVPMPPRPAPPNPWEVIASDAAMATYEARVVEYHSAALHNVAVMREYAETTARNTADMPSSYGNLLVDHAGVGALGPRTTPVGHRPEVPGVQARALEPPAQDDHVPDPRVPVPSAPPANAPANDKPPNVDISPPVAAPVDTAPSAAAPAPPPPGTAAAAGRALPAVVTGPVPLVPAPVRRPADFGPNGTPPSGAPALGPRRGVGGPFARNGRGAVEGPAPRGPVDEDGGRGTPRPGGSPFAAQAAGRGGVVGLAPATAGPVGAGGRDTEHERAEFLLEADAEALFGPREAPMPPVIGE